MKLDALWVLGVFSALAAVCAVTASIVTTRRQTGLSRLLAGIAVALVAIFIIVAWTRNLR
ncbi:hypothetical protein ACIBQ6_15110 [Nonomuraea sp. NPDC049655]|uniref:hypothetical protein n=1 Tax=Nonomuraea sp. NPDC049655 TaxID=3364355 RepID=UPI0037B09916